MKIDVEGAEMRVLNGARETLRRHMPTLIFECDQNSRRFGHGPADVLELLYRLGYRRIICLNEDGAETLAPSDYGNVPYGDFLAQAD